jgi:mttA/Hcf106 family
MFDFSPEKLLLIAAVALIFVGPKRLPAIGRTIGRWLGDFRRATGSLADEMKEGLAEPPGSPPVPPAAAIPAPSPGPPPPPVQATAPPPVAPPPAAPAPPPGAPPPAAQP